MLKPSANMITVPHKSTYSLVIAVAKRARQIAQKAEDVVQGKYFIIEPEEDAGQEDE